MADYIKREDAYEELVKELREPCPHENCVVCQKAADAIEELSKRKVGRWDDKVAFYLKCAECGCCLKRPTEYNDVFLDRGKANYCPNCGARMED